MKSKNDASQTLFRFVSLRNPQLTEIKRRNLGFIHRPSGAKGLFDEAVSARLAKTLKLNAMSSKIRYFDAEAIKSEKELETGSFSQLLIIGRKISKQEKLEDIDWSLTKEYYKSLIDDQQELTVDAIKMFEKLWNNFIYQVISQKDFYVKEAITHILKAIHLGFAQNIHIDDDVIKANSGKKPLENALNAKVVLPTYLFGEDQASSAVLTNRSTSTEASVINESSQERIKTEAKIDLAATKAILRKTKLEKLNSELDKIRQSYHASYYKAYNSAFIAYTRRYQGQQEQYDTVQAQIELLEEQKGSEEELRRLYERLRELEVPAFEFSYASEINITDLQAKLTAESLELFMELFSIQQLVPEIFVKGAADLQPEFVSETELRVGAQLLQIDDRFLRFDNVFTELQNQMSEESRIAMENANLPQTQYANIGGALVPIANSRARTHLAYSFISNWYISAFVPNNGFVNFSLEVEDNSWSVANAKITMELNSGHYEESIGNVVVNNGVVSFPALAVNRFTTISSVKIDIYFNNGREAYLELSKVPNNEMFTGILILKPGREIPVEEPYVKEPKVRQHFGIKRLGIADYLKVVQSVHAYVPGLVSNIENVMASELRHKSSVSREYSEITDTTSKSVETEKVSDTSKTSRTDMQTEVAKELDKQQSITAYTRFSYGNDNAMKFDIGADYANNTAQHDSTRQAVMKSQEITERAMERVLTKINEERIQKIIKEYTETNVHEFDNRGKSVVGNEPPQHITGVYRWVDMKYKNQIYNYGKRTMFEFMVPEPAKLHRLALTVAKGNILKAPVDPRTAPEPWNMRDIKAVTDTKLQYWADIYGVTLDETLKKSLEINHDANGSPNTDNGFGTDISAIQIPANYVGRTVVFACFAKRNRQKKSVWGGAQSMAATIRYSNLAGWDNSYSARGDINTNDTKGGLNLQGNVTMGVGGENINHYRISAKITCQLSEEYLAQWRMEQYKKIIAAYEEAYKKFLEEQARLDAEQKAKEEEAKDKVGKFYRYMEHDVLKHNCIAYLLQDYLNVLGQVMTNGSEKDTLMENYQVYLGEDLDKYTALAKFMEQAFEWEVMDYTFYPYYWANRKEWQDMYISESVDPLFRSFLQAGMARVVVTVKPGFEDAVQFFLTTGKIWNGGEVPVIGDPMYMSIVDEMRQPTGEAQGKFWITRMPTTLTILQDKSTGLPVEQPLPIFPETDHENCENPSELEDTTSFEPRDIQLQRSDKTESTLG